MMTPDLEGDDDDPINWLCFIVLQEFDQQQSDKVKRLFDNILFWLYEKVPNIPQHSSSECDEWTEAFPHIR